MEESTTVRNVAHTGCPSFFRGWCSTAAQGGEYGYDLVGYQFARKVSNEPPYSLDDEEWDEELAKLNDLLWPLDRGGNHSSFGRTDESGQAVLAWFDEHYPRCMQLVPRRRRQQFLAGVYEAADDEGHNLFNR